jgi:Fe-S-cluster containining protein
VAVSGQGFACARCGQCCRGRGGIWLTDQGREAAARALGVAAEGLAELCLEPDRGLWAVKAGSDGYCGLWDGAGCRIHAAKPLMCRAWPLFRGPLSEEEAFLAARDACPGLHGWDWERLKAAASPGSPPPKSFRKFLLDLASRGL